MNRPAVAAAIAVLAASGPALAAASVQVQRVPDGGIQPRVAVGEDGSVHLVYFTGDPAAGDVFYVRSSDDGKTFSAPARVSSRPGSAVAVGTIRGARIALGRDDRVHVVWNGSRAVETPHGSPMLYSRLREAGTGLAFEPERNLMTKTAALDGGGAVAADRDGNVHVLWHANERGGPEGEGARAVWVATSEDEGETFSPEIAVSPPGTGACGCCGLEALADGAGRLFALYRTATNVSARDMRLLVSRRPGDPFRSGEIDPWSVPMCVMSLSSLCESPRGGVLAAWETEDEVFWGPVDAGAPGVARRVRATGSGERRKHPVLAANAAGEVLLGWTEGTAWKKGGSFAWQLYDGRGAAIGELGRVPGVPVWSFGAVFATRDGSFVVLY